MVEYTLKNILEFGFVPIAGNNNGWNFIVIVLTYVLCGLIAYLLGSLNFGIIISTKKFKDDIRSHGSGNAGTTNMMRTYGKTAALFTILGDFLKAVVAIFIVGRLLGGNYGSYIAGLGCVLGHCFPLYYKFRGGKGVAVMAMMVLCTNPLVFAVLLVMFVLIVGFTKYISLGSIICMLIYPLILYRFSGAGIPIIISVILALLIIFLHRTNITRLREGTESKFSFKSKEKINKTKS